MITERFSGSRKIIESDSVYLYDPNIKRQVLI